MTVYKKSENIFVAEIPDDSYTSGTSPVITRDVALTSDNMLVEGPLHAAAAVEESLYWENNYVTKEYVDSNLDYKKTYGPAYLYGAQAFYEQEGKPYQNIDENVLSQGWESFKDKSELTWERAKKAVQDAYNRLFNHTTGNTDQ